MKRFLNKSQYLMTDREREDVWRKIRGENQRADGVQRHERFFRPALTVSGLAAVLTLAVVWQLGVQEMRRGPVSNPVLERRPMVVTRLAPEMRTLKGRIRDRETRAPIEYANVVVRGTTTGTQTNSRGEFELGDIRIGDEVELSITMLSYADAVVTVPAMTRKTGASTIELEPVIVEQLQSFDVEGNEYMVEISSSLRSLSSSPVFDRYAIESVEESLAKRSGIMFRAGEVFVRGGRSGDVALSIQAQPDGSVTGGVLPPNGAQVELMYFDSAGVNPFVATEEDALSTFAVDVDNASWTLARNYLARGILPPKEAIRVEEFVNAFDAGWQPHTDGTFQIHLDGGASRFGEGRHLLRIGLVGKDVEDADRKAANLIFVVDVSGSMNRENRLALVKKSLHILLAEMREGDQVGLVIYGSTGRVVLPLTDISRREQIGQAIDSLQSGGSTNAAEGLRLAYEMARENYDAGVLNRVILCSDGVANNGVSTEAGGILAAVRKASDEGITLSSIGFGMGNYNDVMMERLANDGDGNYYYVDKLAEAERVFRENLTGLLQTIAREVKVQVEFDPDHVLRWRLLGYENRDIADEDFRNDKVDAGEVGAGHQVTALYELKLATSDPGDAVGTVRLRYEAPAHDLKHAGEVSEIEMPITVANLTANQDATAKSMKVQFVVAEFAEILRGSYWARDHELSELVLVADALASELPDDERVQDLAKMVRQAADITVGQAEGQRR